VEVNVLLLLLSGIEVNPVTIIIALCKRIASAPRGKSGCMGSVDDNAGVQRR